MAADSKVEPQFHLGTAHILFLDVVGYSKLLVNEQREVVQQLTEIVRNTPQFCKSDINGKLIRIPIGDGMALVFFQTPEEPVQCAMEIAKALKKQPHIRLRMGVHSGPVDRVKDVNDRDNVAGSGINIAQRVMSCGDAGHILLSKRVAEDLAEDRMWQPLLHELGEIESKHGMRLAVVNLYSEEIGNPRPPIKLSHHRRDLEPSASAQAPVPPEKSIAVLPFVSMSSEPENEYLSDGLTEDLIMAFSRLKGLRVPARTSSFAFKGKTEDICRIGQQLNVMKILEGSVRKVGNRLRITAQLINAADGDHLWAQTFDRNMQEVFAIQDEITREIVRALEMQLISAGDQPLAKHGTHNTDAYQIYLQGRYHFYKFTGEGFRRSIECCKKALQIEPRYALAYAALSLSYQLGWFYGHLSVEEKPATTRPQDQTADKVVGLEPNLAQTQTEDLLIESLAKPLAMVRFWSQAAEKAVELDPNLAETQTVLGMVRFWNERDWPRAEDCFKQAIKLNPNHVTAHEHYAMALACMRRPDEAMIHARLAQQLDPLSPMISMHVGFTYWLIHRYDLLLEQAHTLFDLESNFFGTYWLLGWAHWCQGMREAAIADIRKAVTMGGGPIALADLGCMLGRLGRKAEAEKVLEDLDELGKRVNVLPTYVGIVHASLGNHDAAFTYFRRGAELKNATVLVLRELCICAGLDELRADPQFPAFLEEIGLEV